MACFCAWGMLLSLFPTVAVTCNRAPCRLLARLPGIWLGMLSGGGGGMWLDGWRQNVEDKIEETEKQREQRIREIEKEFNKQLRPLYDGMSLQLPSFRARLLSFLHSTRIEL